jgi:hypothetical protein
MDFTRSLLCQTLILFFVIPTFALQQKPGSSGTISPVPALKEIASLPKHIREASGLAITASGHLWTHNDGGTPILFCLDTLGNVTRTIQLNHPNSGWEDLTLDKQGNMYVGGFGNNKNDKRTLKIYRIPNPESIAEKIVNAEIIKFTYEDQYEFPPPPQRRNFDVDAFIARNDSLFLFTKNRTSPFSGYSKVYRLSQDAGEQKAVLADSIFLGKGPMMDYWVTGAALSPDEKSLVLLSHRCIWIITGFKGNKFSTGKVTRLDLNHFSHKAGVAFESNSRLFIVDELEMQIIGGKLYTLDLGQVIENQ